MRHLKREGLFLAASPQFNQGNLQAAQVTRRIGGLRVTHVPARMSGEGQGGIGGVFAA